MYARGQRRQNTERVEGTVMGIDEAESGGCLDGTDRTPTTDGLNRPFITGLLKLNSTKQCFFCVNPMVIRILNSTY